MKKGTIVKIHPEGARLTRADGSEVNIGDEVSQDDGLTLYSEGGAVTIAPSIAVLIAERPRPPSSFRSANVSVAPSVKIDL